MKTEATKIRAAAYRAALPHAPWPDEAVLRAEIEAYAWAKAEIARRRRMLRKGYAPDAPGREIADGVD